MEKSLRKKYFGDRAFYKTVLAIALPIMLQNGITQFVGMLDNIMVGRVGTEQMTGVSIANTLFFVFNLTIFGAVSAAGFFTAQFFGTGNHDGIRYAFRFKVLFSLLLTAVGIFVFLQYGDVLVMLYLRGKGSAEEISASLGYAREYLRIMLLGLVPYALAQCYASTLRESGQTVVPMLAGIVSVLINLLFNSLLIFGLLGFPKMGSAGAAIATVISRFAELGIVLLWTHRNADKHPFIRGAYRSARIPKALTVQMIHKTLPLIMNETLWAGGMAMLTQCYSTRGYHVVAANNIASTLFNVFSVAFLAMGNSIGIIVGQLLGAEKYEEAKDTNRKMIVFSFLICAVTGAAMSACSPFFPKIYNTTDEIRSLATALILLTVPGMLIDSIAQACYFTLRSGGKIFITILFDSMFVCLVTVPLALVLTYFVHLPILPLFLICQLVNIFKCVIGLMMVKKGIWIKNIVKE